MDLETRPTQEQPSRDLTDFGTCVYTLMLSRGYKTVTSLAADMREEEPGGFKITKQAVSNYTTGRRHVPPTFVSRLVEVLKLNQREKAKLAWAFAYGQG